MISKQAVYELKAQAELTEEEAGNVKKYKVEETTLVSNLNTDETDGLLMSVAKSMSSINLTVAELIAGKTLSAKDITEIMLLEEQIKSVCEGFKTILEAMANFCGQEVIEY